MTMDAVIQEIKELKRQHDIENAQHNNMVKFESVMRELEHHVSKQRTKPSNIRNRLYYGSTFYNWFLQYFGY